jgi:putative ABC transport system permease protein
MESLSRLIEATWLDVRVGARILWQAPAFSATIAVLIALTVGVSASAFSIVHGLLAKPARGVSATDLVMFGTTTHGRLVTPEGSYRDFLDYAARTHSLQSLAALAFERMTISVGDGVYGIAGVLVSDNYFPVLGVPLTRGRNLRTAEESPLEVVLSHQFWQDHFDGAHDILGRVLLVNGHPAEVVGVAPAQFRGVTMTESDDVWVALQAYANVAHEPDLLTDRRARRMIMIGRLAPGVRVAAARSELQAIASNLQAEYPSTNTGISLTAAPYTATALGPLWQQSATLFGILVAMSIVALVAVCLNAANLMLARAVERHGDVAVRQTLGASRARIFRQQLAEAVVISSAGAVGASLVVLWLPQLLFRVMPPNRAGVSLAPDVTADMRVLAYAAGLSLLAALAFTALPAFRLRRVPLAETLRANTRMVAGGRSRPSRTFIVVQIVLAVVLVMSAALTYRSLTLADAVDLRFDKRNLLLVTLRTERGATVQQHRELVRRFVDAARAIPGVQAVSFAESSPGASASMGVSIAGLNTPMTVDTSQVGPDYLAVLGLTLLQGRGFQPTSGGGRRTAMVNANLAAALWPDAVPIGQELMVGDRREPAEVVGVVPNGLLGTFRTGSRAKFVLLAADQDSIVPQEVTFYIRYATSLDLVVPPLRAAFRDINGRMPIVNVRTMETQLRTLMATTILLQFVLSVFAAVCLLVAAIGLYASIAFAVRARSREFGGRIALGATPAQIVRSVVREGVRLASVGLLVGLVISAAGGQAFRAFLVGVTPTDPLTFAAVFVAMGAIALLAVYLPARRVVAIDPVKLLRQH